MLALTAWFEHGFCVKKTPYFKGFHYLFGRAKKSSAQVLAERTQLIRNSAPGQLCSLFADAVEPEKILNGAHCRQRIFTPVVTFWLMLGQALNGGSLRRAIRELQASQVLRGEDMVGSSASYSDARKRLRQSELDKVHARVYARMSDRAELLGGRRIMVVDGTGIALEDTPANQDGFPQPPAQKEGCGFPVVQLLALMNLHSAGIEHTCASPIHVDEGRLFACGLIDKLQRADVLMADRAFCSFLLFAQLAQKGVDALMRLSGSRKWPRGVTGDDCRVEWKRPPLNQCPQDISKEQWEGLPEVITVRYIRRVLQRKGFRDQVLMVATTLLEEPAQEILAAYARRWEIELSLDDIKTTLGMDFVRARTPAMALKMITMHLIGYNLIRLQIQRAAQNSGVVLRRISFKGTLDAVIAFSARMQQPGQLRKLTQKLLEVIASELLPLRPLRIEPRVRKRRPKTFPLMTQPRDILRQQILQSHAL